MSSPSSEHDYVIVGGGTAGSVLAARLSEQPDTSVALLEAGPTDVREPRAREIGRWAEMIGSEFDRDYGAVPQPRANSDLRQPRGRILGGSSNLNLMIMWRPLAADLERWRADGVTGWDAATFLPYFDRLQTRPEPIADADRNECVSAAVEAAAAALDIPVVERWNDGRSFADGTGWLEIAYDRETGQRRSASSAYLHPVIGVRPNLELLLETDVLRIELDDESRATGVEVRAADGTIGSIGARREVILACGAIDTPRLLMLSGIGPKGDVQRHGIRSVVDVPGVGANLMDHSESLVVWETSRPTPSEMATGWDAAFLARTDRDSTTPDVLAHISTRSFYRETIGRVGYSAPASTHFLSMSPNVTKPRSRGSVKLASADPGAPPLLDYRYYTDPDGHDEATMVAGVRMARRIAATAPLDGWIAREVFPGPDVESDEEISSLERSIQQSVFHVSSTCRMGSDDDPMAVLDSELRVRGTRGLRVADASALPSLTALNPVATVLMLAERAVDLIRDDAVAEAA